MIPHGAHRGLAGGPGPASPFRVGTKESSSSCARRTSGGCIDAVGQSAGRHLHGRRASLARSAAGGQPHGGGHCGSAAHGLGGLAAGLCRLFAAPSAAAAQESRGRRQLLAADRPPRRHPRYGRDQVPAVARRSRSRSGGFSPWPVPAVCGCRTMATTTTRVPFVGTASTRWMTTTTMMRSWTTRMRRRTTATHC